MQRRKFVIGLGSLAAGGAAATGTGAFTSVEADRQVDVQIADDSNAYLGLQPGDGANGVYAEDVSNNEIAINFNDINDGNSSSGNFSEGGTGVNPNAHTVVQGVFKITNQGTQSVEVSLSSSSSDDVSVGPPGTIGASDPSSQTPDSAGIKAALETTEDQLSSGSNSDDDGAVQVDTGESVAVDFAINSSESGLSGDLTIEADADTTNA